MISGVNQAVSGTGSPRKGAFFMTKELRFDKVFWDGGTVNADQWFVITFA